MSHEEMEPALRSANIALSGRKHTEVSRRASIEFRFPDARSGSWEAAAVVTVGLGAILLVLGIWFW